MLVEGEIWTIARTDQGNAVLVKPVGSEKAVPIFIAQLESQSILIGLGKVKMSRPLTHDLLLNIFQQLNIELVRVEITALKADTYYAQLVMRNGTEEIVIDARPSDSLALAVRQDCPIFIAEDIIEQSGIPISTITDIKFEENGKKPEKEKIQKLLEKAIEDENYEDAAKFRDQLKKIEEN